MFIHFCLYNLCLQQFWPPILAPESMLESMCCSVFSQEMVSSILLENLQMGNWDCCLNSWRTIESHSLYWELWKKLIRLLVVENTQWCWQVCNLTGFSYSPITETQEFTSHWNVGCCSNPNWKTIVHQGGRNSCTTQPRQACAALPMSLGCRMNLAGWF